MKYYIMYNPRAGTGNGRQIAEQLQKLYASSILMDLTEIQTAELIAKQLEAEDRIVLCGGDGTLNRFINDTEAVDVPQNILYLAAGNGNDFMREIKPGAAEPVDITRYLKNLPTVEANGRRMRFLNGVGYGIDGYCCEEGEHLRSQGKRRINYTTIAIGGLLGGYQPGNAEVVVDGHCFHYKNVWLAPTMKGKYYGGGMIPAPEQDRFSHDGKVSLTVIHNSGKLKTLAVFPSLFQGTHVRHQDMVTVHRGREIIVWFDSPTPLQVDGETISNVSSYHVRA